MTWRLRRGFAEALTFSALVRSSFEETGRASSPPWSPYSLLPPLGRCARPPISGAGEKGKGSKTIALADTAAFCASSMAGTLFGERFRARFVPRLLLPWLAARLGIHIRPTEGRSRSWAGGNEDLLPLGAGLRSGLGMIPAP